MGKVSQTLTDLLEKSQRKEDEKYSGETAEI